ncbi:adenylate/guanylate cyclase domain-containing protein [Phyllobacterium endophyticum]|uniref:Adenylate/guanylate cyclase domain-containing protein n=1 Tax=Phyllobacterium endophyticum TaxID=1149773 RepID=A0A2P7ANX7_9HYPH|nr:adenylate/guanylate cyclase domain-containing protein [Phyllobacterium endophyticum]MBB3233754.1 adenylate cyclase [Phyllobacterium endophyticum]PSH55904.1 adenylate/guanylate cyclase domain-containing protein [Phyllobacterium endophyticum]TYR41046.1 2Fe-2S iron-sulfur cluster binding domain-containing protein [Phyllobacterium endophyticum]
MTVVDTFPLLSERSLRRARLVSGLVMLVFVTLHLANHALNLISLDAAEKGRLWFTATWRNPLGSALLYGSVLVHILLVMRSLYKRRTLVMPLREAMQIILGLLIPLLIIEHVIATRISSELLGTPDVYASVIRSLWINSPMSGLRQSIALVVVWMHGCIGVHFWLRYRPWYHRAAPLLLTFAILLPVLALLGFASTGRILASEPLQSSLGSGYPASGSALKSDNAAYSSATVVGKERVRLAKFTLYGGFAGGLLTVFAMRTRRNWRERSDQIAIRYPEGQVVNVPRGFSVLEASRLGGIPHYAVCGGKGRCSTCRVQVLQGAASLPPAETTELATLDRINADPGVRLACQLRPTNDISVVPMLVPTLEAALPIGSQQTNPGREQEIVILFCDIRNFTMLTQSQLPYDIVFLLNRYFAIVGQAVEGSGGRLDKFIGDGAMALFGLRGSPEEACRNALKAAARIASEIDRLNDELSTELSMPLRVAIGVHSGPAIVGAMGYGNVKNLTAIGDTVNVASRLETVAKELDSTLVVSEPTILLAGSDVSELQSQEITIRGRAEPLRVYIIHEELTGRFA